MKDPAVCVRVKAVSRFQFLQADKTVPMGKIMPGLINALNDQVDVQRQAIRVLWKLREKAAPAVGALTKLVSNQAHFTDEDGGPIIDENTREMERFSFLEPYPSTRLGCGLSPAAPSAPPKWQSQLALNTFNLPTNALPLTIGDVAAIALRDIDASAAYPIFLNQMKNGSAGVRVKAIYNLGLLTEHPQLFNTTIPKLIESLDDPLPEVRFAAISALAQFGTNAQTAVPGLVKLSRDKSPTPYFTRYEEMRADLKGRFPFTIAETANIALREIVPEK
jgi:HEAT repeat protein